MLHQWAPGRSGDDLELKQTVLRWGMATFALVCFTASATVDPKEVIQRGKSSLSVCAALSEAESLYFGCSQGCVPYCRCCFLFSCRVLRVLRVCVCVCFQAVARTLELGYLTDDEAATVAEAGYAPLAPLLWLLPLLEHRLDNDAHLIKATDLVRPHQPTHT